MDDLDRMFETPFSGGGPFGESIARGPAIDVLERGDQLVVRADVPGYAKEDIKLEVTDEGLTLEGEQKKEHEEQKGGFYRRERSYGSFRRLIPLPEGVDADTVRAEMKDGVLEVCFTLPEQRTKRKRIEITEGAGEPKSMH